MPVYKVNVKWGKENFTDVEVNTDDSPLVFKAQLFALSSVQPDRQKILIKGQSVNDTDWSNVSPHLKNGITLMMMGSVDKLPDAPVQKTQFMEDLTEAQLAMALDLPVGLKNLGNTCYLNAVVQCLKTVPELCTGLTRFKNSHGDMAGSLTLALRDLYDFMDKYKQSDYPPLLLVQLVKTVFPQFSTMGENGVPQQQDANEFLTELLRVLQQKLPRLSEAAVVSNDQASNYRSQTSIIDQYFAGEFTCTMKNEESPEEQSTPTFESFLQLSCFISQDVKYLYTGLKTRLEEKLTKNSPTLGRDALFTKTSRINRLPAYLCIQLVRFFYKEKEKVSAKVLKDVKFPIMLDVFDLCTSELQQRLMPAREKFRLQDEDENRDRKSKKMQEDNGLPAQNGSAPNRNGVANGKAKATVEYAPFSFENDVGSNSSGFYDLHAVLTHKGRSANSGHYVGWAKDQKSGQWYMYDDDNVSKVGEEEILKLSGGGDWHTAYVLFYGPRRLEAKYLTQTSVSAEAANTMSAEVKVDSKQNGNH